MSQINNNNNNNNTTTTTTTTTSTTSSCNTNNQINYTAWTIEEVYEWALKLKYGDEIAPVLQKQEIDGEFIGTLTEQQLTDVNQPYKLTVGSAKSLMSAIGILKESQPPPTGGLGGSQQDLKKVQKFWEELHKVTIKDNILQLPDDIGFLGNSSKARKFYIRKSYVELQDQMFQEFDKYDKINTLIADSTGITNSFVITGNPGIGKSIFLYFIMYIVSKSKSAIVMYNIHSLDENGYYLYTYDKLGNPIVYKGDSGTFAGLLNNKEVYFLVDSKFVGNKAAKTIIVSYPDPSKYKEFLKNKGTEKRYMPVWDKDELDTVRANLYPKLKKELFEELWTKWGGIPRFVLENAENQTLQNNIENAISSVNLDLCVKSINEEDPQAPSSHKVIQIIPYERDNYPKYSNMELQFSSKYVAQKVTQGYEESKIEQVISQLKVQNFLHSPLGCSFFESVVHRALKHGGSFKRRNLSSNIEDTVVIPNPVSSSFIKTINSIGSAPNGQYLLPSYSNFPVVDSIIKPNQLFHVTVSPTHPPLMEELTTIVQQLNNPANVDLYFVVPPDQYNDFKKQNYITSKKEVESKQLTKEVKTVTQYVLLFPLTQ